MRHTGTQPNTLYQSGLYRIVFQSVFVKYAIGLLFITFLLQPIAPAYANEEGPAEPKEVEVVETVSADPEPAAKDEPAAEEVTEEVAEESEAEAAKSEDGSAAAAETDEPTKAIETEAETDEQTVQAVAETVPDQEVKISDEVSKEVVATSTGEEAADSAATPATSTDESKSTEEGSVQSGGESHHTESVSEVAGTNASTSTTTVATSTEPESDTRDTTAQATSTEPTNDPVIEVAERTNDTETEVNVLPEPVRSDTPESDSDRASTSEPEVIIETTAYVNNDLNRHQFAKSECVSVGDGSFYCSKDTRGSLSAEDGVYARQDGAGDHEIYYRVNGEEKAITANAFEDLAPHIDTRTEMIVWHRLVEGRYQIMLYDLSTDEETQLTNSGVNNMEPAIHGDMVVWQQWHGGDWEVVFYDGEDTTRITDNAFHDVAPTIRDGFVMWHTTNDKGERLLSVYEIATEITSTIADPDGGHVENPRFVFVYDTKFDNGDVITKQYDPETGEIAPIGSEPGPVPTRIPDPEPAGETRALIQNKSTTTEEELISPDSKGTKASSTPPAGTATTTAELGSTADPVIDLNVATTTNETLELTDFDLIVEPLAATSSAQASDTGSTTNTVE